MGEFKYSPNSNFKQFWSFMSYEDFFKKLTGYEPYPWQRQFAQWDGNQIAVVNLPTGTGKEFGATIPWLYGHYQRQTVPNRLIYCLPTRSLVDQVYSNIQTLVEKSGLSIDVYCLKGGKIEQGYEDQLTQPSILIGTQDQLLSRALNRGYTVSWAQRPKHAGVVNNDCRWVLDETQLMGVGYTTAVKLHELRQQLGIFGKAELVLMSATQNLEPLKGCSYTLYELSEEDRREDTYLGQKLKKPKPVMKAEVSSVKEIAQLALKKHHSDQLTLVVLNTVKRAREVGDYLKQLTDSVPILTIHSRFLGFDRNRLQKKLYGFQGIVVATQVVEAGVDLDASTLITELCPWSSLVQRVGRCGRTNLKQVSQVFWLDWQLDWNSLPYDKKDCEETKEKLSSLSDVGLLSLLEVELPHRKLPKRKLGKEEIEQFFTTHPQLRSTTYSTEKYVRDAHSYTARVFWAEKLPKTIPHQIGLCPVPVNELNKFLKEQKMQPYVWGEDQWEKKSEIEIGDVVHLPYTAGGYSHESGWTGNSDDFPTPYSLTTPKHFDKADSKYWVSLKIHSGDAAFYMKQYAPTLQRLGFSEDDINLLIQCARWHDWGKAHDLWQDFAKKNFTNVPTELVAKFPDSEDGKFPDFTALKGFRHELASAIAAAKQQAPFLAQYLIAAHHGKVRETLLDLNGSYEANSLRGVTLGSELPVVELGDELIETVSLNYSDPKAWEDQVFDELLEEWGVFKLLYLETLIRNADVAASKYREKQTHD